MGGQSFVGPVHRELKALFEFSDKGVHFARLEAGGVELHREWTGLRLEQFFGDLTGRRVCVLGLAYKPGTDSLRQSGSIRTCRWLGERGAVLSAFDPLVKELPAELSKMIRIGATIEDVDEAGLTR